MGEHREDAFDDNGFDWVNDPPSSLDIFDHIIAKGLAGRGSPLQHATQLTALGLLA
ncbi:hypothetical protein [Microvirga arabica]|uniref:hypothetical protein n=1 Tax=Microvirga arabica TaxID=1128671 RepID=UPI001FEBE68F|nr:hypothetical protein [Microvirga arabica]